MSTAARILALAGRALGALSGTLVTLLWLLAIWLPASGGALSGISLVVALLMVLIALFVVIAALRGHSLVLVIAFVASFFPIGIQLAGSEHWMAWIGRLNAFYLIAALLLRLGAPPSRRGERM